MEERKSELQKAVEELGKKVERLEEERLMQEEKERREFLIKMVAAMYDKASAYTRVIFGVGYAGFFLLWINLKDSMDNWERLGSGTGILISVTIYILAEVNKMWEMTKGNLELKELAATPVPGFQEKLDNFNKKQDEQVIKRMATGNRILFATLLSGLTGIGIMLISFFRLLATG